MVFKVFPKINEKDLEIKMNNITKEGYAVIQVLMQPNTETSDPYYTVVATEVPGFREHQEFLAKQVKKEPNERS